MATQTKLSKNWTLIEAKGIAAALFNAKSHTIFYNWVYRPDYGNLSVNSFVELSTDEFYNKLEKIK